MMNQCRVIKIIIFIALVPNCMSCHKPTMVITRRAHCKVVYISMLTAYAVERSLDRMESPLVGRLLFAYAALTAAIDMLW